MNAVSLDQLLQDLSRVARLSPEEARRLIIPAASLVTALAARAAEAQASGNGQPEGAAKPDQLLDVRAAAKMLQVSTDWLYRRARKLPFTVRLGARQIRFSAQGIDKYIRQRQGR